MRCAPLLILMMIACALVSAPAMAGIHTETVEYRDGPTVLEGYLAYDDAQQSARPGVVVYPEWWGTTDYVKHRADMLAKMGYVAFAADIYGKGMTTDNVQQAATLHAPFMADRGMLRQRAMAGLETLMNQKYVDKARVAAIGYCFGGAIALELARAGTPLAGVISFHGDLSRTENEGPDTVKAKVLVCSGTDDPFAPAAAVSSFEEEMKLAKANYQINLYGGAKHAFTNPDADAHHVPGIEYNAQADARSWEALNDFFAEVFAQ